MHIVLINVANTACFGAIVAELAINARLAREIAEPAPSRFSQKQLAIGHEQAHIYLSQP
jgi:hypothetical protein